MKVIQYLFDRVNQSSDKKILLYIFSISIIIRLLYIVFLPTKIFGDAMAYDRLAIGLSEGRGYGGGISSYFPPGQSFFLAVIYIVFGYNPQIAYIFEVLISSFTCITIYYIGKTVYNKKIGIISGLIATFYPTFIIFSGVLGSETLFIFLFNLSILFLLRFQQEQSAKNILIAGVSFGLATHVRPAAIGFVLIILIWILLTKKDRKRYLIKSMLIFLIAIAIISPWTIRNYNVFHEFVLVSTNNGDNFWNGNNPEATGTYNWDTTNNPLRNISNDLERSKMGYEKGLEFINKNPNAFLILSLKKFSYFWGLDKFFFYLYNNNVFINPIPKWLLIILVPLTILPIMLILPFAIFGIIFYDKWNRNAYVLILWISYFTLIHSIVFGDDRFRLQIISGLIIFTAYGICSVNRVKSKIISGDLKMKRKMIVFVLSLAILITCWFYSMHHYLDIIKSLFMRFS